MHPKVYEAAKLGDFDNLMTVILGNGEDLFHQTTPKENNILHVATQYNQVNLIKHFLQCPSVPSLLWQRNAKGDTPLHIAATLGSCKVAQVFIDLAKSLHWVPENGQVDRCKELLKKQNLHKDTALHYAVRGGHELVVKLLIEEGPQLCDITNSADESPLYLATDREYLDIMELILCASSLPSSHKGPKGFTALHAAIGRPMTIWEKILENKPEVIREGDDMGWTPLHYVAFVGNVEVVRLLLQQDTSTAYDLDKIGESALLLAAYNGHLNVIDQIVKYCPDAWDLTSTKGQTALHAAVNGGQVNVVKDILRVPNLEYLIKEQDTDGNTALHLAVLRKRYKIIIILAQDKRLDRLASNKDHLTAIDIFNANEVSLDALEASQVLKGSEGMPDYHDVVHENGKKLKKQFVTGQPAAPLTTGASKKAQQIMAVLIATVTFSAIITMPGGYNNDGPNKGRPILADSFNFLLFVACDSAAFLLSFGALFMLYIGRFMSEVDHHTVVHFTDSSITIASFMMMPAFFSGLFAVLKPSVQIEVPILLLALGLSSSAFASYLDISGFITVQEGQRLRPRTKVRSFYA